MTGRHKKDDPSHQPRRDRMYEEHVQDPYQSRGKPPEPCVCPDCGVLFHKGRWQWGEAPADAHPHRCPACQRCHDRVPASILTLSGDFFAEHRDEIMNLIHNHETKEKADRPLERIMDSSEEGGELVIRFTGAHLARGTGEALHHAYQGELDYQHTDKDDVMRVTWRR